MTWNKVGGSLPTSVSGHITSFPLFVSQLSVILQKTDIFSLPRGCDDSFEQVPSTSSELPAVCQQLQSMAAVKG